MDVKDFKKISIGDRQTIVKKITSEDVNKFAELTGDCNPLHVNKDFAKQTSFKDIVAHGLLGAAYISTVIGTRMPGPGALWVSQNFDFLRPVRLGDVLYITAEVLKKNERERLLTLDTRIKNQNDELVLSGRGDVIVLEVTGPNREENRQSSGKKVALVTGGAGDIGSAICLKLAEDGHFVIVHYNSDEKTASETVQRINKKGELLAIKYPADVSSNADIALLIAEADRVFGGIDILINNASPPISPKSFDNLAWGDVQKHLDVQVKGALALSQAIAPSMKAKRWGRIINVTSQVAEGSPVDSWTAYAIAKSALKTLSNYMAAELGPFGITSNCVAPGMCDTQLIGNLSEKTRLIIAGQNPLRRLAQPEDVSATVAFLASDSANYITGQTIKVNGGSQVG